MWYKIVIPWFVHLYGGDNSRAKARGLFPRTGGQNHDITITCFYLLIAGTPDMQKNGLA